MIWQIDVWICFGSPLQSNCHLNWLHIKRIQLELCISEMSRFYFFKFLLDVLLSSLNNFVQLQFGFSLRYLNGQIVTVADKFFAQSQDDVEILVFQTHGAYLGNEVGKSIVEFLIRSCNVRSECDRLVAIDCHSSTYFWIFGRYICTC